MSRHGKAVCRHPFLYIGAVLAVTAACGVGLLNFHQENRPFRLWIPEHSDFVRSYEWMQENFPREHRFETAILEADDVLQRDVLLEMLRVHDRVSAPPAEGPSWEDVCARLPTLASEEEESAAQAASDAEDQEVFNQWVEELTSNPPDETPTSTEGSPPARRRRQAVRPATADFDVSGFDDFDPSVTLSSSLHCFFVNTMRKPCWEANLLELWKFDRDRISNLTREDILRAVNTVTQSPVFGYQFNISRYLGGISRDAEGRVTGARAAYLTWTVKRKNDVAAEEMMNDAGTGEPVDRETMQFENHFLTALASTPGTPGVTWYYSAGKSFGEVSNSTIFGDVKYLVIGYIIMFIYIQTMLGRCNFVEHRSYLSILGVVSVFLAVLISFGLCSAMGVFFGPVHNILPLLLLGLGVDDMFVILQCWETLSADEKTRSLEERVGRTMQHAGVSITVTSLTDFVAFAIGASTLLPSLESFCVYAAVGIMAVYLIQATWFVAWFTLDQRRIEARRDGVLFCYVHHNWTPNRLSQQNYFQDFFSEWLAPAMLSKAGKLVVVAVTAVVLAINAWGLSELRQEFNPLWFIPSDTYLGQYHRAAEHYFPNRGANGMVFLSGIDFEANMPQLAELSQRISADPSIVRVESWYDEFQHYVNYNKYGELPERFFEGYEFLPLLGQFMFSPRGGKFQSFLRFNASLECGSAAPPLEMAMISFVHKLMSGPKEHIPAMLRLKAILASINFTGPEPRVAPLSEAYASWETDQVIERELYRNMGLAMVCVFVMVLLLIADISVSLLVLACVVLTLVDVGGLMHFWGLTIDTVSCIDVVLAIGLCVDYAAHVGHTFLTQRGSRTERASQTLSDIGPAVFNGGFSTFLAFIFLSTSSSHVFITFFKVFFGVTIFGLWHGLVLLPVLLSLVGPQPYLPARDDMELAPSQAASKVFTPPSAHQQLSGKHLPEANGSSRPPSENGHALPAENGRALLNGSAPADQSQSGQTDISAEMALVPTKPLSSPESA